MAFKFGLKIDLVGQGASPPGGWPQYKMTLGQEDDLAAAKADFFEVFQSHIQFFYSENVRLLPELGRIAYPGIGVFWDIVP